MSSTKVLIDNLVSLEDDLCDEVDASPTASEGTINTVRVGNQTSVTGDEMDTPSTINIRRSLNNSTCLFNIKGDDESAP
jgi:hypothetical protein